MHPPGCKCTPRQRKSPFLGNCGDLEGGRVSLVHLAGVLMVRIKKRSSTFLARKVHPQRKSWLRLCFWQFYSACWPTDVYLERRLGICRSIAYQLLMSPLACIYDRQRVINWLYHDIDSAHTADVYLLSLALWPSALCLDHLRDPSVNTATFAQSLKIHLFTTYQHA